jgi:hypothetical protein
LGTEEGSPRSDIGAKPDAQGGSRPTLHKDGFHKAIAKYDDRGNQIEWAFFDMESRPIP